MLVRLPLSRPSKPSSPRPSRPQPSTPLHRCIVSFITHRLAPTTKIIASRQLPPSPLAHDAPPVHRRRCRSLSSAAGQTTSCPRFHHLLSTAFALSHSPPLPSLIRRCCSLSHPPLSLLVYRRCPILWLIGKSELGHWSSPLVHHGRATSCLRFRSLSSTAIVLSHPSPLPLVSSRLPRLPYLVADCQGVAPTVTSHRVPTALFPTRRRGVLALGGHFCQRRPWLLWWLLLVVGGSGVRFFVFGV